MTEREHQVFGDWRDLRGAIEAANPDWQKLPEDERDKLWKFATAVIANFSPLRTRCWTCREVISWHHAYRCADCRSVHCEICIRPHFEVSDTARLTNHSPEQEQRMPLMSEDQIKHMANRFLGWRLPENFKPDAGISFKPTFNDSPEAMRVLGLNEPSKHQPTGTNLFDATQAEAMVRYMVEGLD